MVRGAGFLFGRCADEGSRFDTGNVVDGGSVQQAAGQLFFVELFHFACGDGFLTQRFKLFFAAVDLDNFVGFYKIQFVFQPCKDGRILGRCIVEHDDLSFHRCILIE